MIFNCIQFFLEHFSKQNAFFSFRPPPPALSGAYFRYFPITKSMLLSVALGKLARTHSFITAYRMVLQKAAFPLFPLKFILAIMAFDRHLCMHFFTPSASSIPPTFINIVFIFVLKSLSSKLLSTEFKSSIVSTTEKLNSLPGSCEWASVL